MSSISVIMINANGLNMLVKRQKFSDWMGKEEQNKAALS